jgi:hypothetical protein
MTPPPAKHVQGSVAWFEMIGTLLCQALLEEDAQRPGRWTLVERYVDGTPLPDGRVQGIRIDMRGARVSYRVGVLPDERGDATIEVTAAAARALNILYDTDPAFGRLSQAAVERGELRVHGDMTPIARVLARTHNDIVDRTI